MLHTFEMPDDAKRIFEKCARAQSKFDSDQQEHKICERIMSALSETLLANATVLAELYIEERGAGDLEEVTQTIRETIETATKHNTECCFRKKVLQEKHVLLALTSADNPILSYVSNIHLAISNHCSLISVPNVNMTKLAWVIEALIQNELSRLRLPMDLFTVCYARNQSAFAEMVASSEIILDSYGDPLELVAVENMYQTLLASE